MNISLPAKNLRTKNFLIKDGILYLRYGQSFEDVMYAVTYYMKGRRRCYYCKKQFTRDQITMDHMYPRDTGGPTIPQNLIPACRGCNHKKANMTYEQFLEFSTLPTKEEQRAYRLTLNAFKEGLRSIGMFEIPNTWITPVKVNEIHTRIDFANISEKKYKQQKDYYEKYHQFQRPIVLDRNLYSLDGFYVLFVAKSCELKYVPAIVLDNVEIRRSNSEV